MSWFSGFFKTKREAIIQIVLVIGILIVANYIANQIFLQFDMTENHEYTLSKPSEVIAKSLKDPVTVTAYFSSKLPPQLHRIKSQFKDFLDEFRAYSGDNLEYNFVDPNKDQKSEQTAQQAGIQPVLVNVRERDQVSQKRAYLGAVFQYEGKSQVVPVVQPGDGLEYTIASTIKKLTETKKPKIGLLQGNGEPTEQEMPQLMQELKDRYQIEKISNIDTTGVPADINVLMIIAPTKAFTQNQLKSIDQYIMAGGKAIFAINKVQANIQMGYARPEDTGIDALLTSYNIPVEPDLVRDLNASSIGVSQEQSGFQFVRQIRYPYIPVITTFGNNPISKGLESVVFQFVSSVDTSKVDSLQKVTVLASSSNKSGEASNFMSISPFQNWNRSDFTESHIPVAALVSGVFKSHFADKDSMKVRLKKSVKTSIIVVGDGDFVQNGPPGQHQQRLPDDNISLMANSVDYLADDTGLIALRTKGITNRPLTLISDSSRNLLKYINVFIPILLVLGYGFYRYEHNKSRRRQWMEKGLPKGDSFE